MKEQRDELKMVPCGKGREKTELVTDPPTTTGVVLGNEATLGCRDFEACPGIISIRHNTRIGPNTFNIRSDEHGGAWGSRMRKCLRRIPAPEAFSK